MPERLALANGLSDEEGCGPPTVRWLTPLLPKGLALGWALCGARGCPGGADGGAAAAAAAAAEEEEEEEGAKRMATLSSARLQTRPATWAFTSREE